MGTVYCDDFVEDRVLVDVYLDFDGAVVVEIGDFFSTAFYEDACDIEVFQRSSFGSSTIEEEYYIELVGNEIIWEYENRDGDYTYRCDGIFERF